MAGFTLRKNAFKGESPIWKKKKKKKHAICLLPLAGLLVVYSQEFLRTTYWVLIFSGLSNPSWGLWCAASSNQRIASIALFKLSPSLGKNIRDVDRARKIKIGGILSFKMKWFQISTLISQLIEGILTFVMKWFQFQIKVELKEKGSQRERERFVIIIEWYKNNNL